MSLFDGLADFFGDTKTQPLAAPAPAPWQLSAAVEAEYDMPTLGMPRAQSKLYQRLSWVQIAVHAVASTAATTALNVVRLEGEDENAEINHPFEKLLDRPNPLQSRYEFLESVFSYRALTGNAYVWLNRPSANVEPSEMWIIPSHKIRPVPDKNLYLRGYIYEPGDGQEIPLELHEVAHFKKFNPLNSFLGMSPIEALATVAVGDMAMTRWNTNFFDKDNAKVPGALAFADPIMDADWERMRADIRKEHGGVKRSLMMLRNVGKGGVEWVNMAMSQKDMEFLNARNANRSEIFSMFAPGLDSILAINATEANALSGKRTFIELGVWPAMVAVAEKFTNDVLPAYGPNLRAEFDDIRITDRALELQEQAAFSQVGTVDEIRQKFYQLQPIGDDRGKLLPIQVTAAQPAPDEKPQEGAGASIPAQTPQAQADPQTATDDATGSADDAKAAKAADLARFKRWAGKRSKPNADDFTSEHLSYEDKAAILWELKGEGADGDTMPPFTWTTGPITPDALKAMILQLDGDDDGAEDFFRLGVEVEAENALTSALSKQRAAVFADGLTSAPQAAQRAREASEPVRDILRRTLQNSASLGVSVAVNQFESIGFGFDWTLANQAAADWADRYTVQLFDEISATTQRRIQTAVSEWVENGEPLSQLRRELEHTFDRKRAQLIASTEVTRAYSEANRIAYRESGVVSAIQWRTSNDERVCPICGPLGGVTFVDGVAQPVSQGQQKDVGQRSSLDGVFTHPGTGATYSAPPAHPRCRCWIVPIVGEISEDEPVRDLPKSIRQSGQFPDDLADVTTISELGGSTGAKLVKDNVTGDLYVMKRGANPAHLMNEVHADRAYQAMGINVPELKVFNVDGVPVKLAKFIDGDNLPQLRTTNPKAFSAAKKKLQGEFGADAILGNWDVMGANFDNIIVDKAGEVWRIDNGGALLHRAQGAIKPNFGQYVDEVWTMRNPQINRQAAEIFGDIPYFKIEKQLRKYSKMADAVSDSIDDEAIKALLRARMDSASDIAKISKTLRLDDWSENYVDRFSRHSIGLRKDGLIDAMPKDFTRRGTTIFDDKGKPWDNLRGSSKDTAIGDLGRYMARNDGDYNIITYWSQRQASDSWTQAAQGAKYFYSNQRGDLSQYWWKNGVDTAAEYYTKAVAATNGYDETLTMWHAYNYEFVRNVNFPNNNIQRGVIKLIRTEDKNVMRLNNLAPGETGLIKRGGTESTSIFKKVTIHGSEVTTQQVPHHRIMGNYFFERSPGANHGMYLGDNENEFLAMMDGLKVKYER